MIVATGDHANLLIIKHRDQRQTPGLSESAENSTNRNPIPNCRAMSVSNSSRLLSRSQLTVARTFS